MHGCKLLNAEAILTKKIEDVLPFQDDALLIKNGQVFIYGIDEKQQQIVRYDIKLPQGHVALDAATSINKNKERCFCIVTNLGCYQIGSTMRRYQLSSAGLIDNGKAKLISGDDKMLSCYFEDGIVMDFLLEFSDKNEFYFYFGQRYKPAEEYQAEVSERVIQFECKNRHLIQLFDNGVVLSWGLDSAFWKNVSILPVPELTYYTLSISEEYCQVALTELSENFLTKSGSIYQRGYISQDPNFNSRDYFESARKIVASGCEAIDGLENALLYYQNGMLHYLYEATEDVKSAVIGYLDIDCWTVFENSWVYKNNVGELIFGRPTNDARHFESNKVQSSILADFLYQQLSKQKNSFRSQLFNAHECRNLVDVSIQTFNNCKF